MPTSLSKWWGSFREMMIPKRQSRRQLICDAGITLGILAVAAAVCTLLTHMGDSDSAVPMVFMLAVLLVARLTDGFLFSLVATVVSVIGVNYAFTYPYFAFNFTITGYPLTFVTMFAVSIVVGMLTDQVKRQERVKSEAEKEKMKANLLRSVFGILAVAAAVCTLLTHMGDSDSAVPMVFMLAVLLVARLTDGFLFSLVATVVSVIGVNYAFTYPYFAFNFTITGYPLTFVTMFAVSIVVGMLTDQVKRQERVKSEAEKEKMKANLLRSVSHDLRTPLTSIIGSSSAVLENYDQFSDEVKKDLIGHVRDDAQWLVRLVENMLSITRFNEGAVQIDKVPQAAEEIAAEAVGKFKKRFNTLPVRVSVPDELLMVPMDATLIEQVLINLMENAVLHAEGATEIELRIRREGGLAQFSVLDNGAGIEPAVLPKLFEEMFPHAGELRGDGRRSMGIGLSVCMSIVRAHGGTMKAKNRATGGACVSFVLPMGEE